MYLNWIVSNIVLIKIITIIKINSNWQINLLDCIASGQVLGCHRKGYHPVAYDQYMKLKGGAII
jgi:hypothetical protein